MATCRQQSFSRQLSCLVSFVCFVITLATPIVMAAETGKDMKNPKEQVQHYFDHFVVGISDLDNGMNLIEEMTGVRPVYGGVHPTIGTRNALISLGDHTYLEIIAPNPDADFENLDPVLKAEFMEPLIQMTSLRPFLWAVGSSDLATTSRLLKEVGVELSSPEAGSRKKPDGKALNWHAAFITEPRSAELPFFISWSDTTISPAEDSPKGCHFEHFSISGPDTSVLEKLKEQLGLDVEIGIGSELKFQLALGCPKGIVTL